MGSASAKLSSLQKSRPIRIGIPGSLKWCNVSYLFSELHSIIDFCSSFKLSWKWSLFQEEKTESERSMYVWERERERERERFMIPTQFQVVVKYATTVSLDLLNHLCRQGSKADVGHTHLEDIQSAIQALDVILRHQTSMRYIHTCITFLCAVYNYLCCPSKLPAISPIYLSGQINLHVHVHTVVGAGVALEQ